MRDVMWKGGLLNLCIDGREWSDLISGRFASVQRAHAAFWVGFRAGLGTVKKQSVPLSEIEPLTSGLSVCSVATTLTELF